MNFLIAAGLRVNRKGWVVVEPTSYWPLAECSSVNSSYNSYHLRALLESRKWWGKLVVKAAQNQLG